ncbi:hypothetical protein ACFQ49_16085 [Kroppenstedtia eburnea]|uniref:Uncharacterized protein n=1 Tax=Kroppenstedtia eburnea TaxID=714067 RepID=A0A1N7JH29_9BACL|nr:hypothetical protein [Kroppenstedtia eburnea]EGK10186.1 hypothetical protein HMPREF9374_2536 [Desmospora sp. 8437]SIS48561.1 hypothetical protein SAMN05421790_10283 [Kroppenstedtia eburnea]
MEKWVQLLVAVVSLVRVLLELPETLFKWKKRHRKQGRGQGRR